MEKGLGLETPNLADNWGTFEKNLVGDDHIVEGEEEESNMGLMDLQFLDDVGLSSLFSPFEMHSIGYQNV